MIRHWRSYSVLAFLMVLFLGFVADSSNAFDGKRKGFMFSVGLGPGMSIHSTTTNLTTEGANGIAFSDDADLFLNNVDTIMLANTSLDDDNNKFAIFTNFKIGYGLTDNITIYWTNTVSWFNKKEYIVFDTSKIITDTVINDPDTTFTNREYSYVEVDRNEKSDGGSLAVNVGGVGVTYFLNPQAPSFFVSAGFGYSLNSYPFQGSDSWRGYGITGGIGYEYSKNWNFELTILYGLADSDSDLESANFETNTLSAGLTINIMGY